MQRQSLVAVAAAIALLGIPASGALASNVTFPARYVGTAASGGTVEFDVAPNGAEITRFALNKVPVPPCGTITGQTPRKAAIVEDSFSNSLGLLHFAGSFPAAGEAQGTISYHRKDGSCDSDEVAWTAAVSLPPTVEPAPSAPPVSPPPPPADAPVPNTKIKSGPSAKTAASRASFRFISTEVGSSFQCKLDRKPWRVCESPWSYYGVKVGRHVFKVKATDAAGSVDPTPAIRTWRVIENQQ
jgi:hypothetical protein